MSITLKEYVLGQSEPEYHRLVRQSAFLEPMTRRTYQDAGIKPRMRVLDVGSGAGDGALLLSEMVGPEGRVIGLEMDPGAVEFAEQRASAAGVRNVTFVACEFSQYTPLPADLPFDAIVGRLVLLYQPDPGAALAKITQHVCPGGIVAFMEPWLGPAPGASGGPEPDSPLMRAGICVLESMRRSGAHLDLGPRLHTVFASAGLPQPQMRFEAVMDCSDESPLFQLIADSFASAMPKAIELGLTTPGEIDVEAIPVQLRAMTNASGYAAIYLATVSAWCTTPVA